MATTKPEILIDMEKTNMRYTVFNRSTVQDQILLTNRQELNNLDELNDYFFNNTRGMFIVIGIKEDGTSMAKNVYMERGHAFPSQTLKKATIDKIKSLGFNIINKYHKSNPNFGC